MLEKENLDALITQFTNSGEFGKNDLRKKYPNVDFDKGILIADANVVVASQQNKENGYPLSNLTAKLFGVLFEIILWIILIGGIVGGGILGYSFTPPRDDPGGYVFLGIILGAIVAFVTIIVTGGLVSLFIKLVNNTEEIKKKIK